MASLGNQFADVGDDTGCVSSFDAKGTSFSHEYLGLLHLGSAVSISLGDELLQLSHGVVEGAKDGCEGRIEGVVRSGLP